MSIVSLNFRELVLARTHGDNNAEKAADYSVDNSIQLFVARLGAVQRPIGMLLLHSQAEKIWFGNYKVEILVK